MMSLLAKVVRLSGPEADPFTGNSNCGFDQPILLT